AISHSELIYVEWKTKGPASQCSAQPQRIGRGPHEPDHVCDVFFEWQSEQIGSGAEVLAFHSTGERLVFHPLHHRRRLEVQNALARTDQRRRGDESAQLVAGKECLFEAALARDAAVIGMRKDGPNDPFGVTFRIKDLAAAKRVIVEVRPALVVEV